MTMVALMICGCTTILGTPTPAASPLAAPSVWDNSNADAITATANNLTEVTFSKPVTIAYIQTDHWNGGRGATPGTIALKAENGTMYGPWQATGANGAGGVKNAYWAAYPDVTLTAGTYTIIDSDPSTWSTNSEANDAGFARIEYDEMA